MQWGDSPSEAPKPNRACRFFNTSRGCLKGDACTFRHVRKMCLFFNSSNGCNRGEICEFIHSKGEGDGAVPAQCPNKDCTNLCLGSQCSACHRKMMAGKQQRKTTELHICPTCNTNQCRGRRCRDCHLAAQKLGK